ncbi:glycosyltransferase family 39 protein [Candidatus Collierbacteria bacterium]|nr:glycosyltransferase family 39 protein [Candidatus Collierbacteria bacterium]
MIKTAIFVIILFLTFFVRLEAIKNHNLPFTTDQGRDMIDIRSIAVGHKPRLIGPTTSINGVYLGPFWYYFNLPPFIASGGDPSSLLIWQIIWYQLAGLSLYLFLKKENPTLALFTSVFFLIMPLGFNTSRYSWNANAMPIFTVFFILALFTLIRNQTPQKSFITGLLAGLSLQVEAAFGVIFFPFAFLYLLSFTKKLKTHFGLFLGFLITLIPQGVFELRHQFPLTKVLLTEFSGKSTMLGQRLSLSQRLDDRIGVLIALVRDSSHLPESFLFPVFIVTCFMALILIFKKNQTKFNWQFLLLNISFILFTLIFFLAFPQPLKGWYLLGLSVPLVLLYSSSLASIYSLGDLRLNLALVILVASSFYFTFLAQSEYLSVSQQMGSANRSSLKNSLADLDWVYRHADGQGFRAYSYLPSIYDYPYQYLYWWYGPKEYGYQPNEVAYLPNRPEYIENMQTYLTKTRPLLENEPTFLIIEKDEQNPAFEKAWKGNFSTFCEVEKVAFAFPVEIRHLENCGQTK